MKKLSLYTIAGGNTTLLIEGGVYSSIQAKSYLTQVEQVGYIDTTKTPSLKMMGNELSINGTLAFASTLNSSGTVRTSGINSLINYSNQGKFTSIQIPARFRQDEDKIFLEGIGYWITNKNIPQLKKQLAQICRQYNYPAFGKIEFQNNTIIPFVYVLDTNSLIKETACGSGSLAFSIVRRLNKIVQPTGKSIFIKADTASFEISANVIKIS